MPFPVDGLPLVHIKLLKNHASIHIITGNYCTVSIVAGNFCRVPPPIVRLKI